MTIGLGSARISRLSGYAAHSLRSGPLRFALIFLLAFSLPIALALFIGGRLLPTRVSLNEHGGLYPSAVLVTRIGEVVRVDHSPALLSAPDTDFVLLFSINAGSLPAQGKRVIVAGKFDREDLRDGGYGVLLEGEPGGVRPLVFWQGPGGKEGKWYPFPMSEMKAGQWVMFILSIENNRFIGLHEILFHGEEERGSSRLIGGYDLGSPVLPAGTSDLLVGDVRQSGFRGAVGFVGIFAGESIVDELPEWIKDLRKAPREVPRGIPSEALKLWSLEGKDDRSDAKNQVRVTNRYSRRRDGASGQSES